MIVSKAYSMRITRCPLMRIEVFVVAVTVASAGWP